MSNEKPVALIIQREIIKCDRHITDVAGEPLRRHLGRETVRQATCDDPKHRGARTAAFIGVNESWWIFRCPGRGA